MLALLSMLTVAVCSADKERDEGVQHPILILETARNDIEIGDPLFLKVTVVNRKAAELRLPAAFSHRTGYLRLDKRISGGNWEETRSEGQGLVTPRPSALGVVGPNSRFCDYPVVFLSRGGEAFVFAAPGRYQLRARVLGDEGNILSEPVDVEVSEATPGKLDFAMANRFRMVGRMTVGASSRLLAPLTFDHLPSSLVRTYLEASREFVRWQETRAGSEDEKRAQARLAEVIKQHDPVMREHFYLGVAEHLCQQQRFDEALRSLDQLPDFSHGTVSLRQIIAEAQAKPAPK